VLRLVRERERDRDTERRRAWDREGGRERETYIHVPLMHRYGCIRTLQIHTSSMCTCCNVPQNQKDDKMCLRGDGEKEHRDGRSDSNKLMEV
jgi:hypothetical protein